MPHYLSARTKCNYIFWASDDTGEGRREGDRCGGCESSNECSK